MAKKQKLDANGMRKFGMRDCLAYAAGDLGCNMSFALKNTMALFWTQFMGMSLWYSIMLLIVQIWDAINDPVIGAMVDADVRTYKRNKFLQYIWFGSVGLIVGGACCFLPFPNAPVWAKFIIFVAGYVIWDAVYTVANVPYGSLLSLISTDPADRASLSAWRSIGGMVGNMLPMVLLPMLIWEKAVWDGTTDFLSKIEIPKEFTTEQFLTNPETGAAYQLGEKILSPVTGKQVEILRGDVVFWAALIMGILGFLCFLFMLKNITIRVDESTVKTSEEGAQGSLFSAFGKFLKNRPAVGCTLAAMGMFLGMNAASTANTIMFATYFNMASLSGVVQMIGFLPMLLFMPFITKIVKKYGKKEASVFGTVASVVGSAVMFLFPLFDSSTGLIVFLLALVIYGLGMGIYTCVSWAMMSDAIDYNEWKYGVREEGTVYALHSFFRKLSQGIGPSAVLLIMGLLGYEAKYGTIAQTAQTAYNMCWLVAGLYAFSALLQFIGLAVIYNLDKKTLDQMNAELAQRHNG